MVKQEKVLLIDAATGLPSTGKKESPDWEAEYEQRIVKKAKEQWDVPRVQPVMGEKYRVFFVCASNGT